MFERLFEKLLSVLRVIGGVSGGLTLIGLAIMWFGVVPMVGCLFGSVPYGVFLTTSILLLIIIIMIIKFVMSR